MTTDQYIIDTMNKILDELETLYRLDKE